MTDHPLKKVTPDPNDPPCPVCGCKLTLERINEEVWQERMRLNRMNVSANGPPAFHTINFNVPGAGGGGGGALLGPSGPSGPVGSPGPLGPVGPSGPGPFDHLRTCAQCGTVFNPAFATHREAMLDDLVDLRTKTTSAVDLLAQLTDG